MSVLPIVDRELRVASRKWGTFLVRGGIGLLAIILVVPGMFFGWLAGGGAGAGQGAFNTLANYLFGLALLGGLLLTADCLSSEKRGGTLGLLFLTDLKGYDVVLGKFAALGLHALYGMMAVFPALALPLLTGGVSGAEFWRVSLALLNLLFVSLSIGMAVSAAARDAGRAFSATLMALLLLVAGVPLSVSLLETFHAPAWTACLAWVNPGHAFAVGRLGSGPSYAQEYWTSLLISHSVAWSVLFIAGMILPVSWQDQDQGLPKRTWIGQLAGNRVARLFRVSRPPDRLERSPVVWLMGDRPVLRILLWSLAGAWGLGVVAGCILWGPQEVAGYVFEVSLLLLLLFALILTEHACRFWVDSRQNGNLEALLAVPLETREIVAGHWSSIRRHFLGPTVLVLAAATIPTWWLLGLGMLQGDAGSSRLVQNLVIYVYMGIAILWFLATFIAIGYTGMWLALKLKRPQYAIGLTLLCVVLLPAMFCWLGFGLTLVFIFLPMSLLQTNLRGMILQRYAPVVHRETSQSQP